MDFMNGNKIHDFSFHKMRIKIKIEYDGSNYVGWQKQNSEDYSKIEDCLEELFGEKILLKVAGRTDAGVHVYGQVAHFDLDKQKLM